MAILALVHGASLVFEYYAADRAGGSSATADAYANVSMWLLGAAVLWYAVTSANAPFLSNF